MHLNPIQITASMLYDHDACPHRIVKDTFADPATRDSISPFRQLLWNQGNMYEKQVIQDLGIPFLDLSGIEGSVREQRTSVAMAERVELIYAGRISAGNLLGDPDLLRWEDGGYVAGDIKSGTGMDETGGVYKPKKSYAMQLALYTDILERKGVSRSRSGFIWDVKGEEVLYEFDLVFGKRNPTTLWDQYQVALATVTSLVERSSDNLPAYSSTCKQCHWFSTCLSEMESADDLTLIPRLGRKQRDTMSPTITGVQEMANSNPGDYIVGNKKTAFTGVGPGSLHKFHERAKLIKQGDDARAYRTKDIDFPETEVELFFDIEVDPMRDLCYLHGFIERTGSRIQSEQYVHFFANECTPESEEQAFRAALDYIKSKSPCTVFYYSKYERTIYRKLQEKYPTVCTASEIEELFAPSSAVDLYEIVLKGTEWPTRDHSIKTLASYLGFSWRDKDPSGAASIEWFDNWVTSGDDRLKDRILEYNEDDCLATRVVADGLRSLGVQPISDTQVG